MDFHGLSRRELQALCKLNKIPANITNVAMADALQSLDIVEGIEEYLNVSQSEAGDVAEQAEKVEVLSPKAPQTRCRTSTRQRKTTETEKKPITATRTTTRRGTKTAAGGVEESKNEMLETPAISSSRRKAVETSSCRNVSSQLDECEDEANEEGVVDQKVEPASVLMCTRRKAAVKKENTVQKTVSTVQKAYSTRRSTRLTEKKSAETRVKKDSGKAVKIDSMDDEVTVESEETNVESENTNVAVGDICNAFEKLDVLVVEKSECSPVLEEAVDFEATNETSNPCVDLKVEEKLDLGEENSFEAKDVPKSESDVISSPCEDESSEQNLDLGAEILDASEAQDGDLMVSEKYSEEESVEQNLDLGVEKLDASEVKDNTLIAPEEDSDSMFDDNASLESGESLNREDMSRAVSEMNNEAKDGDRMVSEKDSEEESVEQNLDFGVEKVDAIEAKDDALIATEQDNDSLFDDNASLESGESLDQDDDLMVSEDDSEEESVEQNLDFGVEKLDASEAKDNTLIAPEEEEADSMFDDNASLESGESLTQEEMSHAVSDVMNNQVQEIDGSSTMASDMVLDNSESDNETESDNEGLTFADEITIEDVDQGSENTEDESFDVTSTETNANEKADSGVSFTEEKSQVFVSAPCFPISATPIKNATPFKNAGIAADDKENIVVEGEKSKQEIDASGLSLRQLRKQLKADSGVSITEERSQFFVSAPCFPTSATPIENATPFKNTSIVTDDKENIVVEVKKSNKEIDAAALSLRQLRKQLKALSLKSNGNADASKEAATARPALQAICENQLVGGETKN